VPVDTMRSWLAHLFHQSLNPTQLPDLIEMLPKDDDIETMFTNGWMALYAQHVADELEAHART